MYALTSSGINDNLSGFMSIQETIASSVHCCDLKINGYAIVKCCAVKQLSLNMYMLVLGCTNGFIIEIIVSTCNESIKVAQTMLKSYQHFVNYDISAIDILHEHKLDQVIFLLTVTSSNGIITTIPRAVSTTPNSDTDDNWTVRDDESNINTNSLGSVWKESQGSVDDEIAWLENKSIFTLLHQNLTSHQSYEVVIDRESYDFLCNSTTKESAHLAYTPFTQIDGKVTSCVIAIFDKRDLCIYFHELTLSLEGTSGHAMDEPIPDPHHAQVVIKVSSIKQMLQCKQLDILGVVFKERRMLLYVTIDNASQVTLAYNLVSLLLESINRCKYIPDSRLLFPVEAQYETLLISDDTIYSLRDAEEIAPTSSNTEDIIDTVFDIPTVISNASSILSNLKLLHLYTPSMSFDTILMVLRALCEHIDDICSEDILSLLATSLLTISLVDRPDGTPFYDNNHTIHDITEHINNKFLRDIRCDNPSVALKEYIRCFIDAECTIHSHFTVLIAVASFIMELSPALHYLLVHQWTDYCQGIIASKYRTEFLIVSLILLEKTNRPFLVAMARLELIELLQHTNQLKTNFITDIHDTLIYYASCDVSDSERGQTLHVLLTRILLLWSRLHPTILISEFEQMIVDLDTAAPHLCAYLQITLCDVLCNTDITSFSIGEETVVSASDLEAIRQLKYSNVFMFKLLQVVATNKLVGTK